jgi:hypothetical protein
MAPVTPPTCSFYIERHRVLLKCQHVIQHLDQLSSDCLCVLCLLLCQFPTPPLHLPLFFFLLFIPSGAPVASVGSVLMHSFLLCSDNQSFWISPILSLSDIKLQCIPSVTHLTEKLFSGWFISLRSCLFLICCLGSHILNDFLTSSGYFHPSQFWSLLTKPVSFLMKITLTFIWAELV